MIFTGNDLQLPGDTRQAIRSVTFLILFFFPLPYAWLGFGWSITLLWIMMIISGFLIHTRFGCARCPFTFCPIGKLARVFWNVKDNRGCSPDNSFPV